MKRSAVSVSKEGSQVDPKLVKIRAKSLKVGKEKGEYFEEREKTNIYCIHPLQSDKSLVKIFITSLV